MSIAGILAKSGNLAPADIDRALTAQARGAHPAPRRWHGPRIGIGCCDDASLEQRPVVGGDGKRGALAGAVWGRLDNRTQLMQELALGPAGQPSDAGLLLRAYERWGLDCLDRVAGDYCCALWDGRAERLVLGRDCAGRRPLVYCDAPQGLYFAAEPRGLLAFPAVPQEVDEAFLATWLALLPRSADQTPYKDIRRVPPGHVLVAEHGSLRLHRYWRPEERPPLVLRDDREYAEVLLATLDEAVRCRLPPRGVVVTTLSAGLDSSAVTALAARQLATQGRGLTAFTAVPQAGFAAAAEDSRLCDEGPLAASVARMYPNVEHVRIPNNARALVDALESGSRVGDQPNFGGPNAVWSQSIFDAARQRRASAFLVATAGNGTASYDGMSLLPSLISRGRLFALAREMRGLRRHGVSWGTMAARSFGPFMGSSLRNALRRLAGKRSEMSLYDITCLDRDFAQASGVEERCRRFGVDKSHAFGGDSHGLRGYMLSRLDTGIFTAGARREYGFYPSDPMADKRLMELCLSIPENQFLRHGEPRSLMRRAMAGILPAEILNNRRRGKQSADMLMTLQAQIPAMRAELARLEASPLARRALDLRRMRELLDALPQVDGNGRMTYENYLGLTRAFGAGVFIRRVEGGNG